MSKEEDVETGWFLVTPSEGFDSGDRGTNVYVTKLVHTIVPFVPLLTETFFSMNLKNFPPP